MNRLFEDSLTWLLTRPWGPSTNRREYLQSLVEKMADKVQAAVYAKELESISNEELNNWKPEVTDDSR